MTEQVALDKDKAQLIAEFLIAHVSEFQNWYDIRKGLKPSPLDPGYFKHKLSPESCEVWNESINALTPKTP